MLTVYAIEKSEIYGHGARAVIWFSGCTLHCEGCINRHMWEKSSGSSYSVEKLMNLIRAFKNIAGVTFIGGEPLQQGEDLVRLSQKIREYGLDIVLFTGYEACELNEWQTRVVNMSSVVIFGRYNATLHDTNLLLRGSKNQQIVVYDERLKEYYSQECRQVEIEITADADKFLGFPENFIITK